MTMPVIDVHETHVEVWWNPPEIGARYQVLLDEWDYDCDKPVRFVYEISDATARH